MLINSKKGVDGIIDYFCLIMDSSCILCGELCSLLPWVGIHTVGRGVVVLKVTAKKDKILDI